jgi:hypothetical protein
VITLNGRPEAVIISVSDLETIEETLDLLSTPGAIDEIRTAEAEIARGEAFALPLAPATRRALVEGPARGLPIAVAAAVTEFLTGALLDNPHRVSRDIRRCR